MKAGASLLLLSCFCANAYAQEPATLKGRVVAGGEAVNGQIVELHRITGASGGITLSVDTTAADGSFTLVFPPSATGEGVHIVTARYNHELYLGEPFRGSIPSNYVLRVGPGATPFNPRVVAPPLAAPQDPERNAAGVAVIAVAALGFGSVLALTTRKRRSPARELLVEIADLDNRHEITPAPNYDQQRADLLERLRQTG